MTRRRALALQGLAAAVLLAALAVGARSWAGFSATGDSLVLVFGLPPVAVLVGAAALLLRLARPEAAPSAAVFALAFAVGAAPVAAGAYALVRSGDVMTVVFTTMLAIPALLVVAAFAWIARRRPGGAPS